MQRHFRATILPDQPNKDFRFFTPSLICFSCCVSPRFCDSVDFFLITIKIEPTPKERDAFQTRRSVAYIKIEMQIAAPGRFSDTDVRKCMCPGYNIKHDRYLAPLDNRA